ncbi:MAG TPA: hypothetical protein VHM72_11205 [Solirubrobacteraceae bacterium]|nr:hypothetical protein [Solirubrobacteraceae bacterium]
MRETRVPPSRPPVDRNLTARRWPWFIAWTLPGACFAISVTALGWYPLLLATPMAVALGRFSHGRERLGLLAGVGIAVVFLGSLHTNYQACRPFAVGHAGVVYSCGGIDGTQWLIVGTAITLAAATLYWLHGARRATTPK